MSNYRELTRSCWGLADDLAIQLGEAREHPAHSRDDESKLRSIEGLLRQCKGLVEQVVGGAS
ncbi:MAG: hypothetical protein SGJ19_22800 [Planctomycetia bacterium]|nr:hypothetical protein [Planctomycetia bacterium]